VKDTRNARKSKNANKHKYEKTDAHTWERGTTGRSRGRGREDTMPGHRHDDDREHGHEHDEMREHLHDRLHEHFGGHGRRGPRGRWGAERGGWGGGRRMRRGDVRRTVLVALREGPANGYEVMRRLEEMSGGLWRPSPGSVYPHLQMLEDEGVVRSSEVDGSRTYALTEEGRAEAEGVTLPFDSGGEFDDQVRTLRLAAAQLMSAAKQLSGAGEGSQVERGIEVIRRARKELYQILAED
jgi:DNA-binding PadR family transcriptional regulator